MTRRAKFKFFFFCFWLSCAGEAVLNGKPTQTRGQVVPRGGGQFALQAGTNVVQQRDQASRLAVGRWPARHGARAASQGMSTFRAVQPETRADRASKSDKTTLEKGRLLQRREKFQRYEDVGVVTVPVPEALSFMSDADRFHTDTVGEEKGVRDQIIQRREQKFENKRNTFLDREESRWNQMEQERINEQRTLETMQNSSKGTRNHSSVAYDAVTLEYHATPAGQQQKFEDDMSRYRAGVRTEKLHRYGSGDGFNPITGAQLQPLNLPKRPDHIY